MLNFFLSFFLNQLLWKRSHTQRSSTEWLLCVDKWPTCVFTATSCSEVLQREKCGSVPLLHTQVRDKMREPLTCCIKPL